MKVRTKRPAISTSTQLKLWLLSGGRCEFPGCNIPLWRDKLTLRETNYSQIAHIISASPNGPRGHATMSKLLEKSFDNLMLLCPIHHKMIDSKKHEDDFSIEYLTSAKIAHEKRIATLTNIQSQLKTNICFFRGLIGGNRPSMINFEQAKEAILPYYPILDHPIDIDLTNISVPEGHDAFLFKRKIIEKKVETLIKHNPVISSCNHFSIFGLAPIPDLIQFGYYLGDTLPCNIFQSHRETASWNWDPAEKFIESIQLKRPITRFGIDIILKIEFSGLIPDDSIYPIFKKSLPKYEIITKNRGVTWLRNPNQIAEFRNYFLEAICHIRDTFGLKSRIHLFPAIPAPIAIELGRCFLTKADPKLAIYDFNKDTKEYYLAMEI